MNARRSFFRQLASGLIVASAPTIFIPKLIKPAWKRPLGYLSFKEFNNIIDGIRIEDYIVLSLFPTFYDYLLREMAPDHS